ncbi:glycosyl hydrolase 115 family protein [Litoribacter alkaliphilus]|uniref:Glycosyl hydrolase 115 family protein n=1 Tax=Litoribacter ruber TaxID=702568 RepID=A0AAP2CFR4_9BACT|nr:glycosyl hydrolase 115 family protein [Litoribacter alkaliphilus]MBS9522729.1 glycosyl hydrolase 115 family protein [Litoribacter alkaliphilus]
MIKKHLALACFLAFTCLLPSYTQGFQRSKIVFSEKGPDRFPLVDEEPAILVLAQNEHDGVKIAAENLQKDIERVTGKKPSLDQTAEVKKASSIVIVGTIGKSSIIDQLIKDGKLDISDVGGKWETYLIQTIQNPMEDVPEALVIAGSDKRGTIFGIYEISEQIGVNPWYWWADVPVRKSGKLFVVNGRHSQGTPAVKYRGIFINDEAPALAGWAEEKFGGFNHKFYSHVFELILRLKGNYLWPAMWGRAIYDDDPLSPELADQYGVVIGTSHHEPLMRAHVEWSRYGEGDWNYDTNPEVLREFWREGIERMGDYESVVTLGMRGDGDEPMSEENNIELLERIVADQREIISEVTNKPITETPQVWALYKEVQDYYDQGMRVPDDVTLLLADDNWGNVRKLPAMGDNTRKGGFGMYYHFDYVGGPRNYKWLNTNPISRVWEQMQLTYNHGVEELWIVNVGDIKPMELPTTFFLDYAWNPSAYPADRVANYSTEWASRVFGPEFATEIGHLLDKYTKYNGRRKPELLDQHTYSLANYNEWERVVEEYNTLADLAEEVNQIIPEEYRDAYYQLVLFPILACSNLNELYFTVAKNHLYELQGRKLTNEMAEKAKELFERDAELSRYYNEELADGKWSHMMDQTHIGYTYWQQPEENVMPEVKSHTPQEYASLGVAVPFSKEFYPQAEQLAFPSISPFGPKNHYFEIFNRGNENLSFEIKPEESWIMVSEKKGITPDQTRIKLEVDWDKVPQGQTSTSITIASGEEQTTISVPLQQMNLPENFKGFVENNGVISIEAPNFTAKHEVTPFRWQTVSDLGRTGSAVIPVSDNSDDTEEMMNYLEYDIYVETHGKVLMHTYLSPTLNYLDLPEGIRFAVSINDQNPQIISINKDSSGKQWNNWVANNINIQTSEHTINKKGKHTIKVWFIDPGVVFQKFVLDIGGLKESYLGPPESKFMVN